MVGSLPAEAERLSTLFSRYFVLAIIFSATNKIRFDASGRSVWLFFYYQFRRNVPRKSNVFTENLFCTITIQDSFFFLKSRIYFSSSFYSSTNEKASLACLGFNTRVTEIGV